MLPSIPNGNNILSNMNPFVGGYKILTAVALGLAAAIAFGILARSVTWLKKCYGSGEKASQIGKETLLTEPQKILELDSKYIKLQFVARQLTTKLPEIPLSLSDRFKVNFINKKLDEIEQDLKGGGQFSKAGWHGMQSLQRIVWQNEQLIETLKNDPLAMKAILIRKKQGKEAILGQAGQIPLTLSSLLLYGLSSNQLSFLATATPNFSYKPKAIDWTSLTQMNVGSKEEEPRRITQEYLERINQCFSTLQEVLCSLSSQPIDENEEFALKRINELPIDVLHNKIVHLVKHQPIEELVGGSAGTSTLQANMYRQCLEVMNNYGKLFIHHNGEVAAVLGYGLVSHALDARHLIAAIYGKEVGQSVFYEESLFPGKAAIESLLESATTGGLSPEATVLVQSRLKQALMTIVEVNRRNNRPTNLD